MPMQCNSWNGLFWALPCSQGLRCAGDGHSITYNICTPFFYASLLNHTASSVPISTPLVPILGVTEMAEPTAKSKLPPVCYLPQLQQTERLLLLNIIESFPCTDSCHDLQSEQLTIQNAISSRAQACSPSACPVPEQIKCPGGCKDYKCQLCDFQHTSKDYMLTHIQQHTETSDWVSYVWQRFSKYAVSLCKHMGERFILSTLWKWKMSDGLGLE